MTIYYDLVWSNFFPDKFIIDLILCWQGGKKKGGDGGKTGSVAELSPWPDFIQARLTLWDKLKKEADDALAAKVPEPITVSLIFRGFTADSLALATFGQIWALLLQ